MMIRYADDFLLRCRAPDATALAMTVAPASAPWSRPHIPVAESAGVGGIRLVDPQGQGITRPWGQTLGAFTSTETLQPPWIAAGPPTTSQPRQCPHSQEGKNH